MSMVGRYHVGARVEVFSLADYIALGFFLAAWIGYKILVEHSRWADQSLNVMMNNYRHVWMARMLERELRIIDTTIMATLQNGTAFFASTSLIVIGGALALLRSTDEVLNLVADLPLGIETTRFAWELKVIGLVAIFGYAFFKFSWSYRLFNYAAILIGATPMVEKGHAPDARAALQPRPARLLLRARLSRLVPEPLSLFPHDGRGAFRDGAAPVRVRGAGGPRCAASRLTRPAGRGRQGRMTADATRDDQIAALMLSLAARCGPGKTLDPTEVARAYAGSHPDAWGPLMQPIRRIAVALAHEGRLVIYRKGKPVDPDDFRGIYRIGLPHVE